MGEAELSVSPLSVTQGDGKSESLVVVESLDMK